MPELRIYGDGLSRTDRVLWLANELGLDYTHVPVGILHGGTRTPEMLALNPNGHVPVIVDDGLVVFESMAINLYLVRKHGGPLAPSGLPEEAGVLQWTFWVVTEIEPCVARAARNVGALPGDPVDPDLVNEQFARLRAPLKVLDDHLADRPHVLGERFTVADLNVAAVLSWAPLIGFDLSPHARVASWFGRCMARPAVPTKRLPARPDTTPSASAMP
jgi:glutathione S-transferase